MSPHAPPAVGTVPLGVKRAPFRGHRRRSRFAIACPSFQRPSLVSHSAQRCPDPVGGVYRATQECDPSAPQARGRGRPPLIVGHFTASSAQPVLGPKR